MDFRLFFLTVLLVVKGILSAKQEGFCQCQVSGSDIELRLELEKHDDQVVGLLVIDSISEGTGMGTCTNAVLSGIGSEFDPYHIAVTMDTTTDAQKVPSAATDCAVQVVTPNTEYRLRVRSIGHSEHDLVTDRNFECSCQSTMAKTSLGSGNVIWTLPTVVLSIPRWKMDLQVLDSNGVDAQTVTLGDLLTFRIRLDNGNHPDGPDTTGSEYVIAYLPNEAEPGSASNPVLSLSISTYRTDTVSVTISSPEATDITGTVTNTQQLDLTLDSNLMPGMTKGVSNKSIHIMADEDISVVAKNSEGGSSGAFTAIPLTELGMDYYIICAAPPAAITGSNSTSGFVVVATADSTTVTITLPLGTGTQLEYDGTTYSNGQSFDVNLEQYEIFHAFQANQDLSGIKVHGTLPIAVFSGNTIVGVPDELDNRTLDHVVEQMVPIERLGDEFIVYGHPMISSDTIYKMVATKSSTNIVIDESVAALDLQPGATYEISVAPLTMKRIVSSQPLGMVQLIPSVGTADGTDNDASMAIVPPKKQWTYTYTFSVPPDALRVRAVVFVEYSKKDGIRKDDSTFSIWNNVTDSAYVIAVEEYFAPGSHTIYHTNPTSKFYVTIYSEDGGVQKGGFAYSGGQTLQVLGQTCTETEGSPLRGNRKDDDCDGDTDEELLNGIDDDGDGKIDEDVVASLKEYLDVFSVYPEILEASADPTFPPGPLTYTIIRGGCRTGNSGSPWYPPTEFARTSDITDTPVKVEAGPVEARRFREENLVYFRAKVGLCLTSTDSTCDQAMCTGPSRRRRNAIDDQHNSTFLYKTIRILPKRDNESELDMDFVMIAVVCAVVLAVAAGVVCLALSLARKRQKEKHNIKSESLETITHSDGYITVM